MPDCNYCEESFGDEQSYLAHLNETHEGELGTIDQRRVDEAFGDEGESGLPTGPLVLGFVLFVSAAVVAYVILFQGAGTANSGTTSPGSGSASLDDITQTPGQMNTAHGHGTIEVVIDGQRIDFSQREYQLQADEFHFENGNGRVWHSHATGVTLEWAMSTLDIGVSEDTVIFDGRTYRDSDPGTNVSVTVNDEPVNPQTYVLQGASDSNPRQGDRIRIAVETNESG